MKKFQKFYHNNRVQQQTCCPHTPFIFLPADSPRWYWRKIERWQHFLSILIVRKLTIGLIIRYAYLNTTDKLLSLKTSPPRLKARTVFRVYALCSCNFPAEKKTWPWRFFNGAYFPSYRKCLRRDSDPEQIFMVVTLVPLISSPKQTTPALTPFF